MVQIDFELERVATCVTSKRLIAAVTGLVLAQIPRLHESFICSDNQYFILHPLGMTDLKWGYEQTYCRRGSSEGLVHEQDAC